MVGKQPQKTSFKPGPWQQLDELSSQHQVHWHWVKGHAGHPGNERADELANQGVGAPCDK